VKGYFNDIGRLVRFVGEPEAYFYRDLADASGVRTLRHVYADIDPDTRHGVVVTTDVAAEGAEFLDGRSTFTTDQVAQSLAELARLHASTWQRPQLATTPWLNPRLGLVFEAWGPEGTASIIAANLHGPNGARVPDSVRDENRLIATYRAMTASIGAARDGLSWCVIHGDPHVGNIFLDSARRPCLLDWQLVQRGIWSVDVGYHIASALTVEDRRRTELDLLEHYLDSLRSFGAEPPSRDEALAALRHGVLHGLFLWGITTKVEPALIEILLHRLGTAAEDHGSLNSAEVVG
jgi:hypothetical protein